MKKLTLLLAAVTIASAAYAKEVMPVAEVAAAPMLTVTSIGQSLEIDNDSANYKEDPNGDVGRVMLGNSVNLAYGDDWTFGLFARKEWDTDTDDGFSSTGSRLDLTAMRSYENYNLGLRWRQEDDRDEYMVKANYSYDMISGWADFIYGAKEKDSDYLEVEAVPVAVTYKTVKLGYYIDYVDYSSVSSTSGTEYDKNVRHQVRISAPIYSTEKLALAAEYRYQFAQDIDISDRSGWQENNRHIVILSADYAVNDNLSLSGYYEYDFNQYDGHGTTDKDDDFYGEFCVGWTYKF